MKLHPAWLASALLVLSVAAVPALGGQSATRDGQPADALASNLALPFASDLTGARRAPVFAWIEDVAGARNVWVGGPDIPAHPRTAYSGDEGIELSEPQLSQNGRRLLFVRGGDAEFPEGGAPNTGIALETPEQALFVADVAGSQAPVKIGPGHGAAFSPDGARVAYTRKGEIWLWGDAAAARRLATVAGSVEDLQWSPDGRQLLFTEQRKGHSFVSLLDVEQRSLRYIGPTLGQSSDPTFSPDARQVAFLQFRGPPADLPDSSASFWSVRIADLASGAVRTIWSAPGGEGGQFAGTRGRNLFWTASGHLLFPWERTGWMHIYAMPAATGGTPRDLTPDANEVETFTPTPDGKGIVYAANAGNLDTRQLWRTAIEGGKPAQLTQDDAFVFRPVFGGDRLAATATDAQRPAHMVLVDGMKPLGAVAIAPSYSKPETIVFTATDGMQVHGQLFRGKGPGPHPALIFVHGGPRRQMLPAFNPMHYYSNAYVRNQQFAALGYTVLSVNYRGGTNYGRAFREAPETGRGGASEYRDVLAGGQWLAKQPDVDAKRIGIWGGSWGGYLTALALARDSDLFAAGADFHGVHTLVRPGDASLSPDAEVKARELQWQSSPMGSIDRWKSPVLIVHGDDDKNVDHDQSLLLARELTARGVPFEELSLPNERHEFFRYGDWLASYLATEAFFARTLKAGK
ncbi:S9 family peptidase [Sphingomonas mali]|uniref:S9 family peptidase n=1 Tax=Sphingomonas mali TaxID=40682 RepID=UPI000A0139ED|nr:prolyl oligopeptidase family serine peptidase [Sphingomonas mali]